MEKDTEIFQTAPQKCFKLISLADFEDFALAAAGTGQQQTLFAGCFIKAAGQGQTI
jgi:hypothetical protein